MRAILLTTVLFTSSAQALSVNCPETKSAELTEAPTEIHHIQIFEDGNLNDVLVQVRDTSNGLPLDSITVRRSNEEGYIFAMAAAITDSKPGFKEAHFVSVPSRDLPEYDFLISYMDRDANCIYESARFEIKMPLNKRL